MRDEDSKAAADAPTDGVEWLAKALGAAGYVADPATALSLWLAWRMGRPLLLEGPAGVGKTELARAASLALSRELVRLQCYEGLDESRALYEWDYAKQMLYTQLVRDALAHATDGVRSIREAVDAVAASEATFFDRRFLLARPLLRALESERPCVLLIDEVDRADPEFEAFLLETLAELQVTIPELGTVRARHVPLVVLTTNGTREMTEALRRRCLHAFLDYPTPERELEVLASRIPGIEASLARSLVDFAARLRTLDLRKAPSLGETIDWARALLLLGRHHLSRDAIDETLGVLLKHQDDRDKAVGALDRLLA
jgi:MoxR-like ATPase